MLTYTRKQANVYVSRVYQTNDLTTWNEILRFTQDTYAKSFEELDGDFYFGLGTDRMYYPLFWKDIAGKSSRYSREFN